MEFLKGIEMEQNNPLEKWTMEEKIAMVWPMFNLQYVPFGTFVT